MLDPRIEAIRKQYDLRKDDFWELPQRKGTWLVKHAALEVIAAKAGIKMDLPIIIEADGGNGVAAVCVQGTYDGRSIWSIGEANPKNNKNSYPWAIAEKRAIDRVVLKLIGLHGLAYSEDEADDFQPPAATPEPVKPSDLALSLGGELDTIISETEIEAWATKTKKFGDDGRLTSDDRDWLKGPYRERLAYIKQLKEAA